MGRRFAGIHPPRPSSLVPHITITIIITITITTMPPRLQSTEPSKLLPPILRHLQSNPPDAYSAHQKARTTAARLIHSSHEDAAIEVLFGASKELLKVREWGSGCDLACYLVQVYTSAGVEVTPETRGMSSWTVEKWVDR